MGYYCTVPQCTSLAGKTKNVKFHRFPRDITMADKWNVILKRGKPYTKYSKVCSLHFTQSDYNVTTMGQWKTLSKDAVPSQNLPKLNPDGTVMVIRKSRTLKYREGRKEDITGDKTEKWTIPTHTHTIVAEPSPSGDADSSIAYRLQTLSAIASAMSPQPQNQNQIPQVKPKKQDAFMQTDPVQSEEDDTQPNNSYSETSDNSFNSEQMDYPIQYQKDTKDYPVSQYQKEKEYPVPQYPKEKEYPDTHYQKEKEYPVQYQKDTKSYENHDKNFDSPKDYTKQEDYIPQTNEEYNKEAEKYALERKSLNGYEKPVIDSVYQKSLPDTSYQKTIPDAVYQKSIPDAVYQKSIPDTGYQKIPDMYSFTEKQDYQNRNDYMGYQNGYPDSVELLRNQQHNLEMLQQQHRITENQNFFNENHIKQEIDINSEEEKYMYERTKDQLDANSMYSGPRNLIHQQRLLEHLVKQEPDAVSGCENVMQPQGSPYYAANGHNNVAGGYYEPISRPGPELLIAKQNALAAHTQLWQNTMKRPFFYSDNPYTGPQLLHRYEDLTRILQ